MEPNLKLNTLAKGFECPSRMPERVLEAARKMAEGSYAHHEHSGDLRKLKHVSGDFVSMIGRVADSEGALVQATGVIMPLQHGLPSALTPSPKSAKLDSAWRRDRLEPEPQQEVKTYGRLPGMIGIYASELERTRRMRTRMKEIIFSVRDDLSSFHEKMTPWRDEILEALLVYAVQKEGRHD